MELLSAKQVSVPPEYTSDFSNGVHRVMEAGFRQRLEAFLERFAVVQKKKQRLPHSLINDFPFVDFPPYRHEIFTRKQDLALLPEILKSPGNKGEVLEVGSWNGWLSKRLAQQGYQVVAADIFTDDSDGLESRQHHSFRSWLPVQTDLTQPNIFTGTFDAVIFNHCIQFLPEPGSLIEKYMKLLKPGGQLIVLGVDYRRAQRARKKRTQAFRSEFLKEHGFNVHFYPCTGFADFTLINYFQTRGFMFIPYRNNFLRHLARKLSGNNAGIYYFNKNKV